MLLLLMAVFFFFCMTMYVFVQSEMIGMKPRDRSSAASVKEGMAMGVPAGSSTGSPKPVLQFLTKLRRHASLEGASPYFKIKKWKLDSSQRASSLDTRGNGGYKAKFGAII